MILLLRVVWGKRPKQDSVKKEAAANKQNQGSGDPGTHYSALCVVARYRFLAPTGCGQFLTIDWSVSS